MQVQVLYFAYFREGLGRQDEVIELEPGHTVAGALDLLSERHPIIAAARGRFRCAVNQEMVSEQAVLREGDELALIPPVAGGSDEPPRHARVLDGELSLARVVAAVRSKGHGGIATFTGQVRDNNEGHDVVRLEYEAYEDMAIKVFCRLCDEIEAEIPGSRLAVEHRVGVLEVGEDAVVIAASAAHRAEAFQACMALIDRLKEEAPIWKKERSPDGEEWIGMGP